jgi:hypothetical protein
MSKDFSKTYRGVQVTNPASDPVNINQSNLTSSTTTVQSGITAASGFIITVATDQEALLVQPQDDQEWFWSTDTGSAPTASTGVRFKKSYPITLNNWAQSIIVAPASTTGAVTIVKGIL